jgi:hypothetical protein
MSGTGLVASAVALYKFRDPLLPAQDVFSVIHDMKRRLDVVDIRIRALESRIQTHDALIEQRRDAPTSTRMGFFGWTWFGTGRN